MNTKVLAGHDGFEQFASAIGLSTADRAARQEALRASLMPFRVTEHYTQLILSQQEPYRTQLINVVLPPLAPKPFRGRFDPYGNTTYRQEGAAFLQHKYEKTLLLHIDDYCVANCQFCYKVREIRTEPTSTLPFDSKVDLACEYLSLHPEIDNVLFTGGDPASFRQTPKLTQLIEKLICHDNIRVVRFATKGLAYDPQRFKDEALLSFFERINRRVGKQVSVIAHLSHPAEFSHASDDAVAALQRVGVQVRGQPAIVRGVNDSTETLIDLQRRFLDRRIISYYLTVFMPVRGVEQYGIPLDEAFRKVAESKRHLSGLEKKGVLLASHDFGKFEICGFSPSPEQPDYIVLKWHQAAMPQFLPNALKNTVASRPEDVLILKYLAGQMYGIDHVFEWNGLPFFNPDGILVESSNAKALAKN